MQCFSRLGALFFVLFATTSSFGLQEKEVTFSNRGVLLSGTLILPETPGPHPALVFLHGSGSALRNEYRLFAQVAADSGFASLIFDKRGCGKSNGSWINSSLEDLTQDAAAGIKFLETRPEINSEAIGIYAISQSGWIACILPSITKVDFMIVVTGGGATPYETEMYGYESEWKYAGLTESQKEDARDLLKLYFEYLRTGKDREKLTAAMDSAKTKSWYSSVQLDKILPTEENRHNWNWVATFDPLPYIRKMKMPILLLFGGKDFQTPTTLAIQRWKEGLEKAENKNFQVELFPEASHALRRGMHHGSAQSEADFIPGYFETMKLWLRKIADQSLRVK
jgi:pimeloyl-ACP methyl ester carboxylesterase